MERVVLCADLLNPPKDKPLEVIEQKAVMEKVRDQPQLTEEEERELAELMDSESRRNDRTEVEI